LWWQLPAQKCFGAVAGGSAVAERRAAMAGKHGAADQLWTSPSVLLVETVTLDGAHGISGAECCAYQPRCLCMEVRVRAGTLCGPCFVCVVCVQVLRFALQQIGRLSRLAEFFLSQRVKEQFACSAQRCLAQIVLSIPAYIVSEKPSAWLSKCMASGTVMETPAGV